MQLRNLFRRNDSLHSPPANNEGFSDVVVRCADVEESEEVAEYQLDKITDEGKFLHPSPAKSKSRFWHSTSSSVSSITSTRRSVLSTDNEPFNMSRASFDSYRKSFDMSTRSPIMDHFPTQTNIKSSMECDMSTFESQFEHQLRTRWPDEPVDESITVFEDVALHEDEAHAQMTAADTESPAHRRRGLFSLRFGDDNDHEGREITMAEDQRSSSKSGLSGFMLFSSRRKAAPTVEVEELYDITPPSSAGSII